MTIRAQTGWTWRTAQAKVREVIPAWVEVTARELPFETAIEVTLRVPSWWRRRMMIIFERTFYSGLAEVAVADAPAGLRVRVRWA